MAVVFLTYAPRLTLLWGRLHIDDAPYISPPSPPRRNPLSAVRGRHVATSRGVVLRVPVVLLTHASSQGVCRVVELRNHATRHLSRRLTLRVV